MQVDEYQDDYDWWLKHYDEYIVNLRETPQTIIYGYNLGSWKCITLGIDQNHWLHILAALHISHLVGKESIKVLKEDIAEQNHLIFRVIKAYSVVLEVHYEELACQDTTHGSTTHECTDRHLNSVASKLLQSYVEWVILHVGIQSLAVSIIYE